MTETSLEAMLSPYGKVVSTRILRDNNQQPRGVGFARMDLRSTCEMIISVFNNQLLAGCKEPLLVKFADGGNKKKHQFKQNSGEARMSTGPQNQSWRGESIVSNEQLTYGYPSAAVSASTAGVDHMHHHAHHHHTNPALVAAVAHHAQTHHGPQASAIPATAAHPSSGIPAGAAQLMPISAAGQLMPISASALAAAAAAARGDNRNSNAAADAAARSAAAYARNAADPRNAAAAAYAARNAAAAAAAYNAGQPIAAGGYPAALSAAAAASGAPWLHHPAGAAPPAHYQLIPSTAHLPNSTMSQQPMDPSTAALHFMPNFTAQMQQLQISGHSVCNQKQNKTKNQIKNRNKFKNSFYSFSNNNNNNNSTWQTIMLLMLAHHKIIYILLKVHQ